MNQAQIYWNSDIVYHIVVFYIDWTFFKFYFMLKSRIWPGVEQLDLYKKIELPKIQKRWVKERLKWSFQLLQQLLTLNPSARIDSDTALNHDFFWSDPMPQSLEKMLSQHTQVSKSNQLQIQSQKVRCSSKTSSQQITEK